MSSSKLFQPITVGDITLAHRVVMPAMTRIRANEKRVPLPIVAEYYAQRASVPGTLLIAEGSLVSEKSGGWDGTPGIYSDEQIAAWKKVTDAVHSKGSFIFLQIWAAGRVKLADDYPFPLVSPSSIPATGSPVPKALDVSEIKEYIQLFATAASNAVHRAGFDGVEIHGANGFLIDQFLQDVSNVRQDEYGGSVENRVRFALEVVDAVAKAVGVKKTGIRLSPWSTYCDMRMNDPVPTFAHLVTQLRDEYPDLAYIHVIEPRVNGAETVEAVPEGDSNDFIREIWSDRPLISAGGYSRELAMEAADTKGVLVAFGRAFLANPDLPYRLRRNYRLSKGDRSTYYVPGSDSPIGYTSYPFVSEGDLVSA